MANINSHMQATRIRCCGAFETVPLILQIYLKILISLAAGDVVVDDNGGTDSEMWFDNDQGWEGE